MHDGMLVLGHKPQSEGEEREKAMGVECNGGFHVL